MTKKKISKKIGKKKKKGGYAILVGAAPGPDKFVRQALEEGLGEEDAIVAVDGGLETLIKIGYTPEIAIGDWDSLSDKRLLERVDHVTLPNEKDRTDLHYATEMAVDAGISHIVCLAVTGGRVDHQIATVYELAQAASNFESVTALDAGGEYHFLSGDGASSWKGELEVGQTVSIFAVGGAATGVKLKGFQYALKDGKLEPSSRGLSNVAVSVKAEVSVRKGRLVVIVPYGI